MLDDNLDPRDIRPGQPWETMGFAPGKVHLVRTQGLFGRDLLAVTRRKPDRTIIIASDPRLTGGTQQLTVHLQLDGLSLVLRDGTELAAGVDRLTPEAAQQVTGIKFSGEIIGAQGGVMQSAPSALDAPRPFIAYAELWMEMPETRDGTERLVTNMWFQLVPAPHKSGANPAEITSSPLSDELL